MARIDEVYVRALAAGATSIEEPEDRPEGDRWAGVSDPFGNSWFIATHVEEVSRKELQERLEDSELQ